MKKLFAILLVVCFAFAVFAQGGAENRSGSADLPKVTWKISHTQAANHYMNIALENMAKVVSEKTDGKFTIEVYHSGTLGSEQEVIENMQLGTIAGNIGAANLIANFVPCFNIFSVPAVFKDIDQFQRVINDPEVFAKIQQDCNDRGIIMYGYFQNYFRQLYTKNPIKTVADFKGQRIRVMGSEILVDTFNTLGANPTTTAWGELYSALQLGVCDGLDHVSTSVKTMAFYENLSYVCEPNIFPTPMFFLISKVLYDKLPGEYKTVFDDAVETVLMPSLIAQSDETNKQDLKWLTTEGGLTYVGCDVDAIHAALAPLREKYISKLPEWAQAVLHDVLAGKY